MVSIGYFLSCEEFRPKELARQAADAGFEQASQLVAPDMMGLPTGQDPEPYVEQVRAFDEVHVAQIGPDQDEFFRFWRTEVAPRLP